MKQSRILLGAFWIEGSDKFFFGLRDAKNYQLIKGGNILDSHGKLLYPDPFPNANACNNCGNKITPTGAFAGVEMTALPNKCSDCGGKIISPLTEVSKKKRKGIFGFFSNL